MKFEIKVVQMSTQSTSNTCAVYIVCLVTNDETGWRNLSGKKIMYKSYDF